MATERTRRTLELTNAIEDGIIEEWCRYRGGRPWSEVIEHYPTGLSSYKAERWRQIAYYAALHSDRAVRQAAKSLALIPDNGRLDE